MGKETGRIGHIHHDLTGVVVVIGAQANGGLFNILREIEYVPVDFVFFMAHKIGGSQCLPETALVFGVIACLVEGVNGADLAMVGDEVAAVVFACKIGAGSFEQVF